MKLPKQLLVGDGVWTVKMVRRIGYDNKTDKETLGLCDPAESLILIKMGQGKRATFETFIHELMHALEFEYDFRMEHKLIYNLESKVAQLLIDNFIGEL